METKVGYDPQNPHIWTYTGRKFHFWNFGPEDIDIEDIAHALSNLCRYTGHCKRFYSVAEHSLFCSWKGTTWAEQIWGLLHDASEAYIGDVSTPLKKKLVLSGGAPVDGYWITMSDFEAKILKTIGQKFDLPWPLQEEIHKIDHYALENEMAFLFQLPHDDGRGCGPPYIRQKFLTRFHELMRVRPPKEIADVQRAAK